MPELSVELDLGPEIAQFRGELREWIAAETPEALAGLADWNMPLTAGGRRGAELIKAQAHPAYAEWEANLAERRLICPQWPAEYGGQGMDAVRIAVLNEEFYRAGVPRVARGMGEWLVGPSIIVHGTPEQKAHFLPKIISGEDSYCQGFSEPDHGSDLAAVETRGVVDGDEIVISGQKVWTSGASRANRMFLLCRTDPDVDKHAGLSYVLIDFTDPGVQYRPIKQMSGAAEFFEDFLDGVRAPLFNVIGGLNNGWKVAMTTLGHERGGRATVAHLGYEREFWDLAETARKRGKTADPLVRQQLAWAYTQVELMRYSGLRTLAQVAAGRPPGPEASVAKLFWSEYHKRLGEIAMAIEGPDGLLRPDGDNYPVSSWQSVFLSSRAGTIYSGTSEIQRNIIGERALGLPKEPAPRKQGPRNHAAHDRRLGRQLPGRTQPRHPAAAARVLRPQEHRADRRVRQLGVGPAHRGERQDGRLHGTADSRPPEGQERVRPAGGAEPARPARARRPGLHPGAGTGRRNHPRRHGRNRHTERGGACLRLPRNRIGGQGAGGRAGGPGHRQRRHRPGPELPGVRQRPHPFGALCPDVAGPADRRPGRGGAAERRPGQRGAGLRQGARHRAEHAHLDGQRGHDEDRRRARLPGRGRGDQGDLPVPRGDRRPGGLRRRGGQGGPGGQADRRAEGRLEPGRPAGRDGPHRLGGRGRRGGRRGAAPAQRHPGYQPGGTAHHRGGPRLQPLARRAADGRADPVRRLVRHHRRRGQRAGPGHPAVLGRRRRTRSARTCRRSPPRRTRWTSPASAPWPTCPAGPGR